MGVKGSDSDKGGRRPAVIAGCRALPKWAALSLPNGCSKFDAERKGRRSGGTPFRRWSFTNDPTQCFCAADSCPNVGTRYMEKRLTGPAR